MDGILTTGSNVRNPRRQSKRYKSEWKLNYHLALNDGKISPLVREAYKSKARRDIRNSLSPKP